MASIREQIIDAAVAAHNAGAIGAPVYRSRVAALSRSQSPAVIVRPASDAGVQTVMPKIQWTLGLDVEVITRGDTPDSLADPILVAANSALLADITLGGLCMQIIPKSVRFRFHDADEPAAFTVAAYDVRYRTDERDLTLQ